MLFWSVFRPALSDNRSLFEGDRGYYVDECLSPGHVLQDRETIDAILRGPFQKEVDYYSSLAAALQLHAEQLPMRYHVLRAPVPVPQEYPNFTEYYAATDRWNDFAALGGMVESSRNRLQHCLASQILQDSIIPSMARPVWQSAPGFPLQHHTLVHPNPAHALPLPCPCLPNVGPPAPLTFQKHSTKTSSANPIGAMSMCVKSLYLPHIVKNRNIT